MCAQTCTQRCQATCSEAAAASSSIPVANGDNVQQFKTLWISRESFTLSLFSSRGNQKYGGWMQYIEISACLCHVPCTMSIYACRCVSRSLWQPTVSKWFAVNLDSMGRKVFGLRWCPSPPWGDPSLGDNPPPHPGGFFQ